MPQFTDLSHRDNETSLKLVHERGLGSAWLRAWHFLNAREIFVNTLRATSSRKPSQPYHSWVCRVLCSQWVM